jgi:hypothetical protein
MLTAQHALHRPKPFSGRRSSIKNCHSRLQHMSTGAKIFKKIRWTSGTGLTPFSNSTTAFNACPSGAAPPTREKHHSTGGTSSSWIRTSPLMCEKTGHSTHCVYKTPSSAVNRLFSCVAALQGCQFASQNDGSNHIPPTRVTCTCRYCAICCTCPRCSCS